MNPLERYATEQDTLRTALQGWETGIWTALPGLIVSYDADKQTAVVQPALKGVVQASDGSYSSVNLPVLPDVPVQFQSGGGATMTFPIKPGDECLVVFSSRCLDGWWQSGGIQLPMEPRMHDLSDGICIVGIRSQPRKLSSVSTSAVQLRSDDGQAYIELNPTSYQVNIITPGGVAVHASGDADIQVGGSTTITSAGDTTLTTPTFTLNGNQIINGRLDATGDVTGEGTSLHGHEHNVKNVTTGSSTVTSEPPN